MAAQPVLEPLIAAGLTVAVRPDGRLAVTPSQRITTAVDAYIRVNRLELISALSADSHPDVFDTPTPSRGRGLPSGWVEQDDARRAALMAAGKRRLAARK